MPLPKPPGPFVARLSKPSLMRRRPSVANAFSSPPVLTVRADLAPPPGTSLPANLIRMPLGGRLEWSTPDLPNATGTIPLASRLIRRHEAFRILRQTTPGTWEDATRVVAGDTITVRGQVYPSAGGATALLRVTDFGQVTAQGSDRVFELQFAPGSTGELELTA